MLVFVDDSGNPGLKLGEGSTRYLVVALVVFEDRREAQAVDNRVTQLRKDLGLHPLFEFKFRKCSRNMRERFFHAVAPCEFFYCSTVINKGDPDKLWQLGLSAKEPFYKHAASLAFINAQDFLEDAIVTLDGEGGRHFRRELQSHLKQSINVKGQRNIRKVRMADSSRNNLLQLADMVAGAVNRSFGSKEDANVYRTIIRHLEKDVKVWPK